MHNKGCLLVLSRFTRVPHIRGILISKAIPTKNLQVRLSINGEVLLLLPFLISVKPMGIFLYH